MDDITLRCHAQCMSADPGTAATSTTSELICPVLGSSLGRKMIYQSFFIHSTLDHRLFAKSQSPMEEHMVRASPPPTNMIIHWWCAISNYFSNVNEVKDDMKWINAIIRLYDAWGRDWKVETIGGIKLGKQENHEKNSKYPDNVYYYWPLATQTHEIGTHIETDELLKESKSCLSWSHE